jgi:hypothetical protein
MSIITHTPSLDWARVIGTQRWRPGSAIGYFQGNPYAYMPGVSRGLQIPLDPNEPADQNPAGSITNFGIQTTSQTFVAGTGDQYISGQPNRVVLVVQNQSSANIIAVNFDQTAVITGTSPNFQSQGIMLQPGVSLWWDKWCPTGTIHISATAASTPVAVMQGFSSAGNLPEVSAIANLIAQLQAMLHPQG